MGLEEQVRAVMLAVGIAVTRQTDVAVSAGVID
jgi:hypothetical protein